MYLEFKIFNSTFVVSKCIEKTKMKTNLNNNKGWWRTHGNIS